MANSLAQTLQINQLLQQQLGIQQQIQNSVGGQATASQQVIAQLQALQNQASGAGASVQQLGTTNQSVMQQMSAAWTAAGGGVTGFVAGLKAALGNLPLIGTTAVATFGIVSDAIEGTLETARATASTMEQLFSSAFNLAKAIFSIEGRIVSGLISMSNEFAAAAAEYQQALEDLRKQLGDFSQNPAANVIGSMREMTGELANTGLSVWRVFGNNAKQLVYFTEMATKMDAAWDIFGSEIAASAEVMGAFAKGMGLSADEMKNFAGLAISTGQNLTTVLQEAANYSLQLGPRFGLSAKVISRDVGKMVGNIKNFGNMTVKQMTQSAIYTRKLGLEMDKILGIVSKFDDFEGAAIATSQLSQAFGLNLDAFKLMEEQDPAKRVDMIRKAMQQAGKSTENMTRQELALLSAQTGLDEAATRQAFSLDNVGTSYDQITKAGSEAENAQLTQAEATAKLAGAIERLVVQGKTFTSFWDALTQGFADGIVKFGPMRTLMFEIHRALQKVYWAGVSMGRAFATFFPGISEGIQGLSKYFSAFNELIDPLAKKFNSFMLDLRNMDPSDVKQKTIDFLMGLKNDVIGFFTTQSAGRNMFLEGMTKALKTFTLMLPGLFHMVIEGLRVQILNLPTLITTMLSGIASPMAASGGATLSSAFVDMISTAFVAFKDIGNMLISLFADPAVQVALRTAAGQLWNAFVTVAVPAMQSAWSALKPHLAAAASSFMSAAAPVIWGYFIDAIELAFTAGTSLLIAAVVGPFYLAWQAIKAIFTPSSAAPIGTAIVDGIKLGVAGLGDVLWAAATGALDGVMLAWGIASPSKVFTQIGGNLLDGLSIGLKDAVNVVSAPFKDAAGAVANLLGGPGEEVDTTVAAMQSRLAMMENMSSQVSSLKSGLSTDIAAVIGEMVKQANDLDTAMSNIGDVNISTSLDKVGKALGIDNKKFTIENKGLNINVNLNVIMDAKELATILTQKNLLEDNKSIMTG